MKILNNENVIVTQQVTFSPTKIVLAVDSIDKYNVDTPEGFMCLSIGNLSSQKGRIKAFIYNKLLHEKWDFGNFPKPELLLFTKKLTNDAK